MQHAILYENNEIFGCVLYLPHIDALLQLQLVVLLNAIPQIRHVLAIGQPNDIGAHEALQLGAHTRKVEATINEKVHR